MWPFKKKTNTTYVITHDGNIALRHNGKTHSIGQSHFKYKQIVEALNESRFNDLDDLLDVVGHVEASIGGVTVNGNGEVCYLSEPLHNAVAERICAFMREGLPYRPLMSFLNNLMENPSRRSVQELYGFLSHTGLPITSDGCFLAYKGVTADFKDIHTRTFDNKVGAIHEMPRNGVDEDKERHCSFGFHVGTFQYAKDFAGSSGHVMIVKVNPRDAVSVPTDHNASKLRVCRYEVIDTFVGETPMTEVLTDAYDEDLTDIEEVWDTFKDATGRRRGPGGRFLPN